MVGSWFMINVPIWMESISSVLGVASTAIGLVVLFYTARSVIIKSRLDALKLKERSVAFDEKMKEKEDKMNEKISPALHFPSMQAVELIKEMESFRAKPYIDAAGVATIGYGTTVYPNGDSVSMKDRPISREEATMYLKLHASEDAYKIFEEFPSLNQNQLDALVSFVYNVGFEAFRKSTMFRIMKEDINDERIANEFSRWNKGGGKVLGGLVKRRNKEKDLYFLS